MHGILFDPVTGRLLDFSSVDEADYVGRLWARTRAHLNRLTPVEQRILRWLLGVADESLSAEEIAEQLNMTAEQVWRAADRGLTLVGLEAGGEYLESIEEAA